VTRKDAPGLMPGASSVSRAGAPLLLNRERATEILAHTRLDALALSDPLNVYYATSKLPVLDRMTTTHQSLAVIPADPRLPVTYSGPAFEYYYNVADRGVAAAVDVHLVAPAAADPLQADAGALMRVLDKAPLDARELHRRAATRRAVFHTSMRDSVAAILKGLGLTQGTIGIDSLEANAWVAETVPGATLRPAADIVRHIRLIKTAAELEYLTAAAEANSRALIAAVRGARAAGSLRALRERFFSETALRGNTGIFMLVDGVMDETYDEPLAEGRAFLVDGVSHRAFYQGDYARTVCMGEPSTEMRRITEALSLAWGEVRERLRPGLRFSQIREIGMGALKQAGYDYTVAFKPHTVGLAHEDQPRTDLDGRPFDLALAEGMVLSVDCPLLDVGVGGSAHLEDLTLITAGGSRPIHTVDGPLIIV
jgi:Xaa-Pro aminopeptidase